MKNLTIALLTFITINNAQASNRAQLNLTGVIEEQLSIEIVGGNDTAQLDLSETQQQFFVGTTRVNSNSATGYNVKISSRNNWKLTNTTNPTINLPYSMNYGAQALTQQTGEQVIDGGTSVVQNLDTDVSVNYQIDPQSPLRAGTYRDTVTFTIEAK